MFKLLLVLVAALCLTTMAFNFRGDDNLTFGNCSSCSTHLEILLTHLIFLPSGATRPARMTMLFGKKPAAPKEPEYKVNQGTAVSLGLSYYVTHVYVMLFTEGAVI